MRVLNFELAEPYYEKRMDAWHAVHQYKLPSHTVVSYARLLVHWFTLTDWGPR